MEILLYIGFSIFVAVGIGVFLLCRDRAKQLDRLGPAALDAELRRQREARK